ncbi:hypothetical protein [Gemmatimonas sp.]|uniref:hypothetical protein n=1 Tax=Gemmatimonas sp. TaxID=1962908 RepID=UPI0027B90167|nr:hypothetical protein [Gemmatimonas sp.]
MSAKFYWYPDSDGSLSTLTLAKPLTELHETRASDRITSKRGDGSSAVAVWLTATRVRIVLERGLSAGNVRDLRQLEDHLQRGLPVGFAREHTKAWAGFGSSPNRGYAYVTTGGAAFTNWETASLVSGDEIAIESGAPWSEIEMHAVSSVSATTGTITLSGETVLHTFGGPVIVRHRDFYPALRMPDDQLGKPIVSTERRLSWTLDVELEAMPELVQAGYDYDTFKALPMGGTTAPNNQFNQVGSTLQKLLTYSTKERAYPFTAARVPGL